jgi:basic membrane protein A and related proteins
MVTYVLERAREEEGDMRRVSKVVALLGVAALLATACGGKKTPSTGGTSAQKKFKIGMVYDLVGRGDKSFNDAAYAGLTKAAKELPIEFKELTPDSKGTNREALARLLAQQDYPFIIGNGFLFSDHIKKLKAEFPNVKWAVTDGTLTETDAPAGGNAEMMTFAENEGSYLAGIAAAVKSKTSHLGFIGGVDTPLIHKFKEGFEAGAKSVKPDITLDVKYLSSPPDFSGFNNPSKGKEVALSMYQAGADIVYSAAGGSGTGAFAQAKEYSEKNNTKVWGIGVDSDQYQLLPQYKDYILTSMLKHVEVGVYQTIKEFVDGQFKGGVVIFDLKTGGVGLSTSGGFIDDIKGQIDEAAQKIKSGEISVPCGGSGC